MILLILLGSIVTIMGATALVNRLFGLHLCPICAGSLLTWGWMLTGIMTGLLSPATFLLPVAILMGGSAVGIVYTLERRLIPERSALLWKASAIPVGFAGAYGVLVSEWLVFVIAVLGFLGLFSFFVSHKRGSTPHSPEKAAMLEEKLKKCC